MITGIGHIAVTVKDMTESFRFYTHALGFRSAFAFRHPDTGAPWIEYLSIAPGQFIELFANGTRPAVTGRDVIGLCHICLQTPDIGKAYEELKAKGITPDTEIRRGKSNCLLFWTHDPDGNQVEIMELTEDSLQAEANRRLG